MENQNNIDQAEEKKFSTYGWWDMSGEFSLLHRINPLRLRYISQHVSGLFGKMVLDVGCGGGILAESMAREGANVTGIDIAAPALQAARDHAAIQGVSVTYQQETAELHLLRQRDHYDVVTCMEMLEHVPDPAAIIAACAILVKPGGHLFFSTINRNAKSFLMAIVAAEYLLKMLPKGTHTFKKLIKPIELMQWFDDNKLIARDITGLHYSLVKNSFHLGKNIDVNYLVYAQCTK